MFSVVARPNSQNVRVIVADSGDDWSMDALNSKDEAREVIGSNWFESTMRRARNAMALYTVGSLFELGK
jgi:hypothetical protein